MRGNGNSNLLIINIIISFFIFSLFFWLKEVINVVNIPSSSFSLLCTYLAYKCKKKLLHWRVSLCFSLSLCLFLSICVCMEKSMACLVGAIVILWCCISHVTSDASDHRYMKGDSVPFYANKVGPFHNPRSDFKSMLLSLSTIHVYASDFRTFQSQQFKKKYFLLLLLCYDGVTILRMRFPLDFGCLASFIP